MSTSVSGLRVYITAPVNEAAPTTIDVTEAPVAEVTEAEVNRVFYSRRGNGPIYRWLYDEHLARWRSMRMQASNLDSHTLANASWKSVPETLQLQLNAHYLD
jgi:hypothetical protein